MAMTRHANLLSDPGLPIICIWINLYQYQYKPLNSLLTAELLQNNPQRAVTFLLSHSSHLVQWRYSENVYKKAQKSKYNIFGHKYCRILILYSLFGPLHHRENVSHTFHNSAQKDDCHGTAQYPSGLVRWIPERRKRNARRSRVSPTAWEIF